ncbi:TrmH family RNA methyltransferase [Streptomyces sp. bgisy130]|uniref:TrmH family RNA methyltransferase n=1 Tax=Streptomyces sp. bgisy130 TaxID=3413788 RepID=UPI003F4A5FE1
MRSPTSARSPRRRPPVRPGPPYCSSCRDANRWRGRGKGNGANLGTLLRTCDAVGACLTVPRFPWVPEALERGNTLRRPACVHWTGDPVGWLERQRARGLRVVGVELADGAVRLADLAAAREPTVMVLGHEQHGIPPEALDLLDEVVEIPMVGTGASLNVAVAGSLVLYRLAGLW